MPKISLLWEDVMASAVLLFMMYGATHFLFSLDRAEPPKPATPVKQVVLSHPLDYKAKVCQADYGEQPVCRYYTERTR